LEYIVGFLGAMAAGFVAVPLSVPQFGAERVAAALKNSSPVALLTTSAVVADVDACARGLPGSPPAVIEIDALDLYTPPNLRSTATPRTKTALLQYTSGSTRDPAGVIVTHKNISANLEQVLSDHFEDNGKVPPPDTTLLSWLPFYHDMGLLLGVVGPVLTGLPAVLMSPVAFLQKPARWMQLLASTTRPFSAGPNFAFDLAVRRTSDADMAGLDLGNVLSITTGAERVQAATIRRFTERFSRFNLPDTALRPSYGLAEAMVYVASSAGRPPSAAVSTTRSSRPATPSAVAKNTACPSWSATARHARAPFGSSTRRPTSRNRPRTSARSGCMATTSPPATGETRN
jgi:long chain fatty acid CoA FadD26